MSLKLKLKENELLITIYDKSREVYYKYGVSDEKLIRSKFKNRLNREVNLINPVKYNDKLQWLKLNWYDPIATKCADKYEVRGVIKEKIGENYLNSLIGVYESVSDIDLCKLPNSFVLKGTHGSGFNIICKDKSKMNWEIEFKKMRRWLRNNYYFKNREWVYRDIQPRIICEEYLEEEQSGELRDYKFFCFNGEPKLIEVDFDRFTNHKRNFYTLDWDFFEGEIKYPNDKTVKISKPEALEEMIELSRILSSGFPHVRVDFYYYQNRVLFGELTFFHESGMGKFNPESFEILMGEWLKLPELKK